VPRAGRRAPPRPGSGRTTGARTPRPALPPRRWSRQPARTTTRPRRSPVPAATGACAVAARSARWSGDRPVRLEARPQRVGVVGDRGDVELDGVLVERGAAGRPHSELVTEVDPFPPPHELLVDSVEPVEREVERPVVGLGRAEEGRRGRDAGNGRLGDREARHRRRVVRRDGVAGPHADVVADHGERLVPSPCITSRRSWAIEPVS
jgi:hypothetical protein